MPLVLMAPLTLVTKLWLENHMKQPANGAYYIARRLPNIGHMFTIPLKF